MAVAIAHPPVGLSRFTATQRAVDSLQGVAIHLLSLEAAAAHLGELHELLDGAEQAHAASIVNRNRRVAHIASRALLRLALSEYCGKMVRPDTWRFSTNAYGKLTLATSVRRRLSFSLSYAQSIVAIGVTENAPLGIDIEPIPDWTYADISWDALTRAEAAMLRELPAVAQYRAYLRIWTMKEAYAKCLGLGVSLDFRDVEVTLEPLRAVAMRVPAGLRQPRLFDQRSVTAGETSYQLAVAQR